MSNPAVHLDAKLWVLAFLLNNPEGAFTTGYLYAHFQQAGEHLSKEAFRGVLRRLAEKGFIIHLPNHTWHIIEDKQFIRSYLDSSLERKAVLANQWFSSYCQLFEIPYEEIKGNSRAFVLRGKVRVQFEDLDSIAVDASGGAIRLPYKLAGKLVKDRMFAELFALYVEALSYPRSEEVAKSSAEVEAIPG